MKKKFKLYIYLALVILFIGIFIEKACITKKVYNENTRDYLVYSVNSIPEDLLLINEDNIHNKDLQIALFEGLVSIDSKGKIVPSLSSSYSVSKDKLSYTFKIREDAKWSNGDKITSQDFVEFFSRILNEKNNSYSKELQCIFGVKEFLEGKKSFEQVAINSGQDNTLEIRLNYPCEDFLKILSNPVFTLKRNFYNLKNWKNQYKKIDYTGAFCIDKIYDDGEISLKKNKMYWDKNNVASNKIHIKESKVFASTLAQYKSNRVDIFNEDYIAQNEEAQNNSKSIKKLIRCGTSLNFNLNKNNFVKDIKFRKGIKYAIDKSEIKKELKDGFTISNGYLPNSMINLNNLSSELKISKKLLEESKYNGEIVKIIYLNNEDNNKKLIKIIEQNLKQLGVNVEVIGYSKEDFKKNIEKGNYDLIVSNYSVNKTTNLNNLSKWVSDSKENLFGYKNINFDNNILRAKMCGNTVEADKKISEGEKILLNDIAIVPLGFYNFMVCQKEYVEGLEVNSRGNVILKKAYIVDKNKTSH